MVPRDPAFPGVLGEPAEAGSAALNARTAVGESEPKFIALMFRSEAVYGSEQSVPPTNTRGTSSIGSTHSSEWAAHSYPTR